MKKNSILLFFIFFYTAGLAGGGWPQPKRKGYFKLGQNAIMASRYFDGNGNVITITPSAGIFTTSLYGEYGITDRFTAIVYAPFFVRAIKNELVFNQSGKNEPGDALNSFGDTDVSLKYGFFTGKPVVMSATVLLGLPLGNSGGGKTGVLQTGDGEFNQMLRFDVSHSFYPAPVYASGYAAYNNRTKNFSDDVRFGAEIGYTLKQKLTIIAKLNVVESLFNGGDQVASNGIFSNNTEYVSPQLEIAYALNNSLGLTISAGGAFAAKNILAAPNMGIGVFYKIN